MCVCEVSFFENTRRRGGVLGERPVAFCDLQNVVDSVVVDDEEIYLICFQHCGRVIQVKMERTKPLYFNKFTS
jgi:hypothetical protein